METSEMKTIARRIFLNVLTGLHKKFGRPVQSSDYTRPANGISYWIVMVIAAGALNELAPVS